MGVAAPPVAEPSAPLKQPTPQLSVEPAAVEMPPVASQPSKRSPRRARYVLAAAAAVALIVYGSRIQPVRPPPPPPPVTLSIGPAWTEVDLSPFRSLPFVGLRSRAALRFRTNEERIQLVQPGTEAAIRTAGVRKLEVRTVGGRAEVTLAPQAQ